MCNLLTKFLFFFLQGGNPTLQVWKGLVCSVQQICLYASKTMRKFRKVLLLLERNHSWVQNGMGCDWQEVIYLRLNLWVGSSPNYCWQEFRQSLSNTSLIHPYRVCNSARGWALHSLELLGTKHVLLCIAFTLLKGPATFARQLWMMNCL